MLGGRARNERLGSVLLDWIRLDRDRGGLLSCDDMLSSGWVKEERSKVGR